MALPSKHMAHYPSQWPHYQNQWPYQYDQQNPIKPFTPLSIKTYSLPINIDGNSEKLWPHILRENQMIVWCVGTLLYLV